MKVRAVRHPLIYIDDIFDPSRRPSLDYTPLFSHFYSVTQTRITRIPRSLELNFLSLYQKAWSLKITPITRILVRGTVLECHSISPSCCIISKNTKDLLTLKQFDFNSIWCNEQMTYFIIKMPFQVTVSDKIS